MLLLPSAGERDCDDGSSNTSTVRITSVLYLHGSRKFPRKCLDWMWQPSAHQFPEPCIGISITATGPDELSLPFAARSMSLSVLPAHRLFYVTAGIQMKIRSGSTLLMSEVIPHPFATVLIVHNSYNEVEYFQPPQYLSYPAVDACGFRALHLFNQPWVLHVEAQLGHFVLKSSQVGSPVQMTKSFGQCGYLRYHFQAVRHRPHHNTR